MQVSSTPLLPDEKLLSVSEVTEVIATAIDDAFVGGSIWVQGEVSNFRGRNQRGHMYFSLKDADALLPCACFARQAANIDFEFKEGVSVLAFGRVDVYAPHGRYQLIVERLLPAGVGKLHMQFEKLKKKLAEEGLFDEQHKKPIARFPKTIGIVTSPTGAVIRDIISVINKRFPAVTLVLAPAQVQGEGAAATIKKAIEDLNQLETPRIDTIIVARGGGSIEDLWPFNEELVARAIFASDIPIVSAVGHETDFTISDFVADLRAATPSQAAELVAPDRAELLSKLKLMQKRAVDNVEQEITRAKEALERYKKAGVLRYPEKIVYDRRQTIDQLVDQIVYRTDANLKQAHANLIGPNAKLAALSPFNVLERGYSIVEDQAGKLISRSKQLKKSAAVNVRLKEGGFTAKVEELKHERQPS